MDAERASGSYILTPRTASDEPSLSLSRHPKASERDDVGNMIFEGVYSQDF
jgi:hypothetical protein